MPSFATGMAPGYAGTVTFRTHSIPGPFNSGVIFERNLDLSPPIDDEIIIATVRVRSIFRRMSGEAGASLPERPNKRGYISRLSSRISNTPSPGSRDRYTAIKMPRRDYKRYFARDRDGNYIGTEPEREWDEADLQREFGMYQHMALRTVPGCSEFGEGDQRRASSAERYGSVDGEQGVSPKDLERKESVPGDGAKRGKSEEEWWL